ncbi:MAG TPA: TRAP transporter large permease, partial [Desulforhopalus sp.]|nr:TRAP transporter large permease [Desulforhopalus sp.]
SGSLGIIIPPSIPTILYCLVMNVSVAKMFLAGVLPGLLIGLVLMAYTWVIARQRGWQITARPTPGQLLHATRRGFWALLLPVIVLGGIYSGVFTPTEAAAVSVIYALAVEMFIYREFGPGEITAICREAAVLSACLLFILSCAMTFVWLLTAEQLPQQLAALILSTIDSPWMFLLTVNLLFLILGCFVDDVSAMLILAPLFLETLNQYGIDLVHFGIVMVLNIQIGMLTPPFGLNLFVAAGISNQPMTTVARGVLPFLGLMLGCLLLITYLPWISLFLPEMLLS